MVYKVNRVDSVNHHLNEVDVVRYIRNLAATARDPRTDGFTQCHCKHNLFLLKCLIDDLYKNLPEFPNQEREWEQKRLLEILQK